MKKPSNLFYALFLIIALGCDESLNTDALPVCIQTIIEEDRNSDYPIQTVREQIVGSESFFLLEDNLVIIGGTDYIFNNKCDSLCYYCTDCILPECANNFLSEGWDIIWEK